MDRVIVYPYEQPLETDILYGERNAMVAVAKLSEAVFGTAPVADGFSLLPKSPASNTVTLSAGQVYQQAQLESSSYSTLPADTHTITKQGIILDPTDLTLTPPPTVGYSVSILIQVKYADLDDTSLTRPYYNAANRDQPYNGPANSGAAQNQFRRGIVSIQPKYGIAASSGTQSTPTPDADWNGLFVVTVAYGQTAITSGNIVPYPGARTAVAKLPAIPAAVQNNDWTSFYDGSSTPNLITGNPTPVLQAYTGRTRLSIFLGNTNTGSNVIVRMPGLADRALVRQSGSPLLQGDIVANTWITIQDDGTQWRLAGLAQGEVPRFVANPTLYVRTDGNDLNDGSANQASKAFKTLTAALIFGTSKISYLGSQLVIILGIPGNYDAPQTAGAINGPQSLLGATGTILITTAAETLPTPDLTQQSAYTIFGSGFVNNTGILHCSFGTSLVCRGFTLQNNNPLNYGNFTCSSGANAFFERVTFSGTGTNSGGQSVIYATGNGQVRLGSGCIVSTGLPYGLRAAGGGIDLTQKLQINGTLNYSQAFASAEQSGGRIFANANASVNTTDLAASVTGYRYFILSTASIFTTGQGQNFFPGSIAGTTGGGPYG